MVCKDPLLLLFKYIDIERTFELVIGNERISYKQSETFSFSGDRQGETPKIQLACDR